MSRALRDLRHALDAAQEQDFGEDATAPTAPPQMPSRASTASAPVLHPVQKGGKHSKDGGAAVGLWVAQRLTALQREEDAARARLAQGQLRPTHDNPFDWSADRVWEWLTHTANAPRHLVATLHDQGLTGVELFTLDDADLESLGCTIAERRRLLHLLQNLRTHKPSAFDAALASRLPAGRADTAPSLQELPSHAQLALHVSGRKERLSVLHECFARVLNQTPALPLKTRRLLLLLFQQSEAVGLEALAQLDRDGAARRRQHEELSERHRKGARVRLERMMAAQGKLEDRLYETERLVEIEKSKLQSMRDAMFDSTLGVTSTQARRKSFGGGEGEVDWRTLRGADFHEVPSNLGELIMSVGDTLSSSLLEAERDATLATEIIEAGDMTLAILAEAEDAARDAAAAAAAEAAAAREQQASPTASSASEREQAPPPPPPPVSLAGSPPKARKKSVKGH